MLCLRLCACVWIAFMYACYASLFPREGPLPLPIFLTSMKFLIVPPFAPHTQVLEEMKATMTFQEYIGNAAFKMPVYVRDVVLFMSKSDAYLLL